MSLRSIDCGLSLHEELDPATDVKVVAKFLGHFFLEEAFDFFVSVKSGRYNEVALVSSVFIYFILFLSV